MLLLGLVGGIASGKSFVAECFRDLGAAVLDADRAGHEVLREPEVVAALRQRWGESILDAGGQISRSAVAKIVFASGGRADKEFLEQLAHPRIQMRLQQQIQQLKASAEPPRIVILDAALLFEAGWDKICDRVIFIDAPRDLRLERAVQRGWSAEQFSAREATQLPVEEKRERSHLVIRNARTLENTRDIVRLTWSDLLADDTPQKPAQ